MTAIELINLLQEQPPEIKVVIRGYEDGYNDIRQLKPLKLRHDINAKWYYGEYFEEDSPHWLDAIELYGENKNQKEI
jgi:hypothetical protein